MISRLHKNIYISLLLLLSYAALPVLFPVYASAEAKKALYLQAGLYSSVSDYTHAVELIGEVQQRVDVEPAVEEYYDFVYNVSPETSFSFLLSVGEKRGLVSAGTFLAEETNAGEQYRFLTETNGFGTLVPNQYSLRKGTDSSVYSGDLLFWIGADGEIVNAGLVCSVHGTYCLVAVNNPEKGTAMLCLSNDTAGYTCNPDDAPDDSIETFGDLTDFIIVRPVYSSAEQQIYLFCRNEMGFTRSGACGILANISYESGFRTDAQETVKTEGSDSSNDQKSGYDSEPETEKEPETGIGICQWSYERREDLTAYCEENGLNRFSLEGQLAFMKYELNDRFSFTGDYLKTVPENSAGAYDAGYWVCFEYEQPVDFEFGSDTRARLSVDSYWPLYSKAAM